MFDVFLHANEMDMLCLLHIQYMAGLLPGIFPSKSVDGEHLRKLWIFWRRLKEQFSLVSLGLLLSFGWSFLLFIRLFIAVAAPLKCFDKQCRLWTLILSMHILRENHIQLWINSITFFNKNFWPLHRASGVSPQAHTSHWMGNTSLESCNHSLQSSEEI